MLNHLSGHRVLSLLQSIAFIVRYHPILSASFEQEEFHPSNHLKLYLNVEYWFCFFDLSVFSLLCFESITYVHC